MNNHRYNLYASGIKFRSKEFDSRKEAEIKMNEICNKLNINVDCTEYDKHERVYSNHNGIKFYINRI